MTLELERLTVHYGDRTVVRDVDLSVGRGEIVAVIGPSGSGKTSILRATAGLEPYGGAVRWDGSDQGRVAAHERGFGLLFQDHALFPHRSVRGNVAFGPSVRGWPRRRTDERVAEVLALVGLADLADRAVDTLSGGEQQRVALARALAPMPRALLLDEPLAALDRPLRERLARDLRALVAAQGVAAIYVTHDQEEALAVADRVAVLRDGAIEQSGLPDEVWARPANGWVARFLGYENVLELDGREVVIPAEALRVVSRGGRFRGSAIARSFRRDHLRLLVRTHDGLELDVVARDGHAPAIGDVVRLALDPARVITLDG